MTALVWHIRKYSPALLAVSGCIFLAFWGVLAGRQVVAWDSYDYFYPKFLYLVDSIRSGTLPQWNPFELSGVPFWPWNGAFLNPINLFFVLLAVWFDPYYVFQLMLLSPVLIGGLGAYSLLHALRYRHGVQLFGAVAFSLSMFGPLLGQYSVAFAVAFMPWAFYMITRLVDSAGSPGRGGLILYTFASAAFIVTAYPVMIFLIGTAAALFGGARLFTEFKGDARKPSRRILLSVAAILGLSFCVSAAATFPMLENRAVVAESLKGDFISPDPRLRVSMDKGAWTQGYESTLKNYLYLSEKNVLWHNSITLSVFFFFLYSFFRLRENKYLAVLLILTLGYISYTHGRNGVVYELVFRFVPLFWNNRYPIFGLSIVKFLVFLVSMEQLNYVLKVMSERDGRVLGVERRRLLAMAGIGLIMSVAAIFLPTSLPFAVSITALSLVLFLYLAGIIHVRLLWGVLVSGLLAAYWHAGFNPMITAKSTAESELTAKRKRSVFYASNKRAILNGKEYIFDDRTWVFSKTPGNHGYFMADAPAYWYVKNARFLEKLFYFPIEVKASDVPARNEFRSDNEFLETISAQVLATSGTVAHVERLPVPFMASGHSSRSRVLDVSVFPNSISARVYAEQPSLLALTDKYYPGWRVRVDGRECPIVRVNTCFKGVYLNPGWHQVNFIFKSKSFIYGAALSLLSVVFLSACWIFRPRSGAGGAAIWRVIS